VSRSRFFDGALAVTGLLPKRAGASSAHRNLIHGVYPRRFVPTAQTASPRLAAWIAFRRDGRRHGLALRAGRGRADHLLPGMAAALIADKAFDGDARVLEPLRAAGEPAVIPPNAPYHRAPL
jgi:hypothetical protein